MLYLFFVVTKRQDKTPSCQRPVAESEAYNALFMNSEAIEQMSHLIGKS